MSLAYESSRAAHRISQRGNLKSWHQKALELAVRNDFLSDTGRTVLELGTSACELLEHIRENYGCRCIAADYPENALEFAKSLGFETIRFDGNDADSISSEYNGIADLVISTATLEHITDVDATLSMVRRLLKPEGHFILAVPNCTSYKHWLHYVYRSIPRDEGHHYRHFAWNNTIKTLVLNGFKILDQEHEVDNRLPVKALNLIVNTLRVLTEPLARRITSIGKLGEDIASYSHLDVINWGFMMKKDPLFIITENPYISMANLTDEKSEHTKERIAKELLKKKLISIDEYDSICSKISGK